VTAATLTVFTKHGGGLLTKKIALALNGEVIVDSSACYMGSGMAQRVAVPDAAGLADLIMTLQQNQAIAFGAIRSDLPEICTVLTVKKINGAKRCPPGTIARTKENITYQPGSAAWVLIDFDRKGMPDEVAERLRERGGLWEALVSIVPELDGAERVMRPSTSSFVCRTDTGDQITTGGWHIAILARDGSDAARFLTSLHRRCWLAGFGWYMVGAGGQLLERSIVDRVVGSPERLIFEAEPVVEPPLAQDVKMRRPMPCDGEPLDTAATCPELSATEETRFQELRAEAAAQLGIEVRAAHTAYVVKQAKQLVERTGITAEAAARIVERQCQGVLLPDVALPFDDPDLAGVTVAEVLADPHRFINETLADPLEGVAYGRGKAMIMRRDDSSLWIHSFAHGRSIFELKSEEEATEAADFSDDRLARLFAERHAGELRHTAILGKWFLWKPRVLAQRRHPCRVQSRPRPLPRGQQRNDQSPHRCPGPRRGKCQDRRSRRQSHPFRPPDRNRAPRLGQRRLDLQYSARGRAMTVELKSGINRAPRPEDMCTKISACAPANIPTPLWDAFLDRVTAKDQPLQQYLQRVAGYCLTGVTSEHVLFFFYGTGANGKGVFLNTLRRIWNDYAVVAPMESFIISTTDRHPTELAHLRGARIVIAQETESGRRWAESKIKALTGGDPIVARYMRQDFFEFQPQFKLLIAGNHKPSLRGVDEAIRRRFHLIPFTVTIPLAERDINFTDKLKPEWPGILQWAVEGCLDWQRIGLQPPKAVLDATEAYLQDQDTLGRWIDERCNLDPQYAALSGELYHSWKSWAENRGEFIGSRKNFSQALDERGLTRKHQRTGTIFFGIALKNPGDHVVKRSSTRSIIKPESKAARRRRQQQEEHQEALRVWFEVSGTTMEQLIAQIEELQPDDPNNPVNRMGLHAKIGLQVLDWPGDLPETGRLRIHRAMQDLAITRPWKYPRPTKPAENLLL
jgi:P4 family phage/plasmid primase-like protien